MILPLVAAGLIELFGYNFTFVTVSVMMGLAVILLSRISDKQIEELC